MWERGITSEETVGKVTTALCEREFPGEERVNEVLDVAWERELSDEATVGKVPKG